MGTVVDPGTLQPPTAVASANVTSGYAPLAVLFSSSGSADAGGGTIVSYSWDFGDGTHSAELNPSHTYGAAGTYSVTLTVTDNDNLTGSSSVKITVLNPAYVDSIGLTSQGTDSVSATATVTIRDMNGNPVSGAVVTGAWSGLVQGSSSGTTGSAGSVSLVSGSTSNPGTITFTITGVTASGYNYDPSLNRQSTASIDVSPTTQAPTVAIVSPAANATISGTVTVQVSASSSLGIASVTLNAGNTTIGTDSKSPYTFSWNTASLPNGTYTLTAIAKDKAGNTASVSVNALINNVIDTTAPTITITSPESGATVSGMVSVKVNVSDDVGVVKVELYVDGASKPTATSTIAPFTTKWNANKAAKGVHTLECKAYDSSGNIGLASVTINR